MFLSKNKFFVCVLLLSVTFYLMSAPIARADSVVDAVTGVFDSITDLISDNLLLVVLVVVTVAVVISFPPGGIALGDAVLTTGTYAEAVAGTGAAATGGGGALTAVSIAGETIAEILPYAFAGQSSFVWATTTYLTYAGALAITGVVDAIALCVGTDTICPGGEDTVLVMPTMNTTQYECDNPQQFQISPTFYIPSFNQGYVTGPDQYCYYDLYEEQICEPIPADAQRYMPESFDDGETVTIDPCATPDPNGTMAMLSGNRCVPVTPGATTLTSIDETNNKIALYRVTAPVSQFEISPGETDKSALVRWFTGISGDIGISEHKFGDGLVHWAIGYGDTQIMEGRPEEHLLAIYPHSKCSGNICVLPDTFGIPENSYVFYAAKILGDYEWPIVEEYSCGDDDTCERTNYETSPAKFLSIQNPPIQGDLAMFPWIAKDRYSIGDVLWGPTQTGSLEECPATQNPQQTLANLIVSTTGTGSGVITSTVGGVNIGGLNCGGGFTTCSNTYDIGAAVTLTATPAAGSSFAGWSGDCSDNSCSLTMNADRTVSAEFARSETPPGPFNWNPSDGGITSTCNQAMLSWTASAGADRYEVRKQTKSGGGYGPWQVIATKTSDATSHTDYNVIQNNDYKYQIKAYNDAGEREIAARSITTPYCSPTVDLSVTQGFLNRIYQGGSTSLTWTSAYATSCTASASSPQSDWNWTSSNVNGNQSVLPSPPPFVDYTITCAGLGPGSASDTVRIDIDALGLPGWREIIPR